MFMRRAWIVLGIGVVVLLGCSPKETVQSDPWAEPQSEDLYADEPDTLTYDFLTESTPLEEASAEPAADLPELVEELPETAVEELGSSVEELEASAAEAVETVTSQAPPVEEGPLFWVQIFASGNRQSAEDFALEADSRLAERVKILFLEPHYKVLAGGFADRDDAVTLRRELVEMGYEGAWIFEK